MDLSSIRTALNGFADATPVIAPDLRKPPESPFLLGAEARVLPEQFSAPIDQLLDLNTPEAWQPEVLADFTQNDALEIDYPAGQPEPVIALNYNVTMAATEISLDGVIVALVQMRQGEGPLRASAIKLIPDLGLAAEIGAQ
jgi:hypothetical protein